MPDVGHYGSAVTSIGLLFLLVGASSAATSGWRSLAVLFVFVGICAIVVGRS